MESTTHDLLRRLADVAPAPVPSGERGVTGFDAHGAVQACVPVLSIYLDWRPQVSSGRPAERPARIALDYRLRQIERTLLPRGTALNGLRADVARIRQYLDTVPPATQGVAIFASAAHQFFETCESATPFQTRVSVGAQPDLFQLARLASNQETAVVAVVDMRSARFFVMLHQNLHAVGDRVADPKFYHMVHGENALNQAHYQRHASVMRAQLAREVADQIDRLVERYQASEVVLAGHKTGMALVREALAPQVAPLVHEPLYPMDTDIPSDELAPKIGALLQVLKSEQEQSMVERLVEAVRADGLGVAGVEATERALRDGQVESLILAEDAAMPPETRSTLIGLATVSDATTEVVKGDQALQYLGGVGALLRYRVRGPNSGEHSVSMRSQERTG